LDQFNLMARKTVAENMVDIVSMTKIPNVAIVGCRKGNYSPDEILPENNLLQHLPEVVNQYDYILMEGSALNFHADSKELAKYAEAIVSVFSSKSVIRQSDKESIKFLKAENGKLIGAVLNEVEEDNIEM
jgi:polysaccharide biosynthesis transport protein